MIDTNRVLDSLKMANPNGFVNETHFQIEFGYALKKTYPEYDLTFEWANEYHMRVDLIARSENETIAFEFKYFTKEAVVELNNGLKVRLKNQLARDLHRIGFWKDVSKIEKLTMIHQVDYGYCLFLTNDEKVFDIVKPTNKDKDYDISDGVRPGKHNLSYQGVPQHDVVVMKSDYQLKHKPYNNKGFYLLDLLID